MPLARPRSKGLGEDATPASEEGQRFPAAAGANVQFYV
jgi:hypothetical protein